MKKQNHNITAYISKCMLYSGKPNQDSHSQLTTINSKKFDHSFPSQSFQNQIVGQMDESASNYLKKLMKKAEKDEQKCRSSQKSLNHERAKSYANLTIDTPSRAQNISSTGHTYRNHEDHSSTNPNTFFFSVNNSPTNQKHNKKQLKFQNQEVEVKSKSFLNHIQDFILKLEKNKPLIQDIKQQQIKQRKTVQRSRQNSIQNIKIKQKLEGILQKEKKLKLQNKFLESQVLQKRKVVKKKKIQCQKLVEGMQYEIYKLHSQIQQQRKKRKNLQKIIFQVQKTFTSLRGQPRVSQKASKTRYSPHSNYLIDQSETERSVDTLEQSMMGPNYLKNQRLSHNYNNGHKSGTNILEMSAMFEKVMFEDDFGENMMGDQQEEQIY